jgi:hypothetical protein
MSTLVQIKRSTANSAPATLDEGELAYSYVSNTLFIGDTANGVMNIGGKYYTDLMDNASAANGSTTFVRRYSNGSAQFSQLDILVSPTANSHVATKQYVDDKVFENISLANLSDVTIVGSAANQNNRILIGSANGEYISRDVTGNVSVTNTGIFTINAGNVTNAMLAGSISNDKLSNANVTITAGTGLIGGGTVDLGSTITIDVAAGDGISNANGDTVSVDSTVVRTDRPQTLNGSSYTFSNTVSFNSGINVTGNIYLNGNTTYINVATLNITDPLIYLASNNDLTDTVDIGFMGGKNTSGQYSHTGLARHAADGIWYLFDNLADEGHQNNVVDVANTTYALLRANLEAKSLNVNAGYANVNTTLTVTGNTSLLSNVIVSQNSIVAKDSRANTFIAASGNVVPPNLANTHGERLRLFDFEQAGHPNYAIGVEPNHIWTGVDDNTGATGFKWYGNTTVAMTLQSNGVLNVANTINVINIFATSLTLSTPLGVGSGGTGANSFTANGVFYGGTSSSLSFATGTEGQVLQIASGVPAFAMLDGGSF